MHTIGPWLCTQIEAMVVIFRRRRQRDRIQQLCFREPRASR